MSSLVTTLCKLGRLYDAEYVVLRLAERGDPVSSAVTPSVIATLIHVRSNYLV